MHATWVKFSAGLEHNINRHSIVLEDAHIPQEAKDGLTSLLEGDYSSIISKSPMTVGRTNLFQMDIPMVGPPVAHKLYPVPLKYQKKFVDEEIQLSENAGCISKSLSLWAAPVIIVPKKPDPTNPCKQQLHLLLDYRSVNKSINAGHNGDSVISYYPLPNIMDLLTRVQNCTIFSSLGLMLGYHHIGSTPEAKLKTAFATTSGKWHWNMTPFGICSLPGVFCYLMLQVLSGLDFCFAYLSGILIYSTSWKEHLHHFEAVFKHLMETNLQLKSSKCHFFKIIFIT